MCARFPYYQLADSHDGAAQVSGGPRGRPRW